jgi:integrase
VHALSNKELRKLLQAARAVRERDWLMILVAFYHGLRASEVTGFTASAVRDGHLTIQRLKGSLKTTQPLVASNDPLLDEKDALIRFARRARSGRPVFAINRRHFWRLVKRYARQAGIAEHLAHPHVLKHSIAMQTIHSAGIENVRQHLGHKSLSSTGAYLRVSDQEASRAIRRALDSSEQESK